MTSQLPIPRTDLVDRFRIAVSLFGLRTGTVLGMWPVAFIGSDASANLIPWLAHALGSTVAFACVVVRNRAGALLALAFTGYSTIAIGLGGPSVALAVMIWGLGLAACVSVAVMLFDWRRTMTQSGTPLVLAGITVLIGAGASISLLFASR